MMIPSLTSSTHVYSEPAVKEKAGPRGKQTVVPTLKGIYSLWMDKTIPHKCHQQCIDKGRRGLKGNDARFTDEIADKNR